LFERSPSDPSPGVFFSASALSDRSPSDVHERSHLFDLFLAVNLERRKGGTDPRLKCNQRVAAVGEGFDKKLESVGRDFRRRVVARHSPNTQVRMLVGVSKSLECA
jgi:hypothetical protein